MARPRRGAEFLLFAVVSVSFAAIYWTGIYFYQEGLPHHTNKQSDGDSGMNGGNSLENNILAVRPQHRTPPDNTYHFGEYSRLYNEREHSLLGSDAAPALEVPAPFRAPTFQTLPFQVPAFQPMQPPAVQYRFDVNTAPACCTAP